MHRYQFKKIDAFVTGLSSGNPAGCVYLPDGNALSPAGMQQIARELAGYVSEVVYLWREAGHTTFCYYSAEREVAFCGHGTIAAMYDLIKNDPNLIYDPIIRIHVGDNTLLVKNEIQSADSVFVSAPQPVFLSTDLTVDHIAAALKIKPGDIEGSKPIAFINAGLATLIVPIPSLQTLLSIHPDQANLKEFCLSHAIDLILVFSEEVSSPESQYRTRVFAPLYGYLEDPATGSGNAALGYHLLTAGAWDGKMISIEQGRSREHPNIIKLVCDESQQHRTVYFGGNAIVRIEGEYLLQM
ncbi:MAG: PhzF family phenazine biosynthesis protein [Methanoregula sp.]|jgi:PhzF family phenazine biosynthesis protein